MVSKLISNQFQAVPIALANYDYYDIAEGTGVKLFYGLAVSNQTSIAPATTQVVKYILSSNSIGSDGETTSKSGAAAPDALALDIDFDLAPFNAPKEVYGTAYVTLNGTMGAGEPAFNHSASFQLNLCRVSNGVETVIGTGYSNPGGTVTSGTNPFFLTTPISISTSIHFQIGDFLRLNVLGYEKGGVTGGTILLYFDPATTGQELKLWLPFRLEVSS